MDAQNDAKYLRLYHEYAKAIQAFENATKDRRRVRNHIAVNRSPVLKALQDWSRRPIGSPPDYRIPGGTPARPNIPAGAAAPIRRIYLGETLGWRKVMPTLTTPPLQPELNNSIDINRLYDQTSLHLYWNTKRYYKKCKRNFFDYVRQQNIDLHREKAKNAILHGLNLQSLGVDTDEDPSFMKEAQKEIEAACQNTWRLYQSSGPKKSTEIKVLLLEAIAEAQFVDLESQTVKMMTAEMDRLKNSGEIR